MAEGADGEEEIQFLRTVSDAVALSAVIKLTGQSVDYCVLHYCAVSDDKVLRSLALCLTSTFSEPGLTRTGGCFCWHCYLFIYSHLFCHCFEIPVAIRAYIHSSKSKHLE